MINDDVLKELNAWIASQQPTAAAAAHGPPPPREAATVADVDATLATYATEELISIAQSVAVPQLAWRYLTAEQQRALRAQNTLARRGAADGDLTQSRAAQAIAKAVDQRMAREAALAAELEPFLEKKRAENARGW